MVAVLFAAEIAARMIEPLIPATKGWPTTQMAAKVDQMTELATSSTDVSVVFLGSSSMDQDVNPVVFNDTSSGLISYNASLNGLSVRTLELWALDVVLPALDPEIVVIGLTTRELNDGGTPQQDLLSRLAASRGLRELKTGKLNDPVSIAEDSLALLRIRESLRRPFSLALQLFGGDTGEVSSLPGPYGQRKPGERDFTYDFSDRWREEWTNEDMRDFAMGGEEADALARMIAVMTNQDRIVVLVPLPTSSDYATVQPGGIDSISGFRTLLSNVARSEGARLVEPALDLENRDFRDPAHLNPVAAEEYAMALAQHLALLANSDLDRSAALSLG
jgi:hypothetical protein